MEVRSEKQKALREKRSKKVDLIDELAALIIQENSEIVGEDIAEKAIEKIKSKDKKDEEGDNADVDKEEKTKRRIRKTKTA